MRFLNFEKKHKKWGILNRKISVTKFQKSNIWIDSFVVFSIAFVPMYFVFFVDADFMEKFASQNCLFYEFSKMLKFPIMLGYSFIFFETACFQSLPKMPSFSKYKEFFNLEDCAVTNCPIKYISRHLSDKIIKQVVVTINYIV